ncbi:MAG: RluA family pseudouridine synthase [bacterium]
MSKIRLHKRINDLVLEKGLEFTKPEVQANIEKYGVKIDTNLIYNRLEWAYSAEEVDISHWPQREKGDFDKIRTVLEKEDFLVIYKPQNVVVEPGAGHTKDNLLEWLKQTYGQEFFLVHRIDKDTQGLLLIAKTLEGQKFYQDQFRAKTVQKKYLAVVNGILDGNLIVKNWQSRDKINPTKQRLFWTEKEALQYDPNSRYAESIFRPRINCKELNQTLVEVEIKTGRMHQIRLQAENLGYWLVADKIYNVEHSSNPELTSKTFKVVKDLSALDFASEKIKLFGDTDYCLLSNFIKFESKSKRTIEVELFE